MVPATRPTCPDCHEMDGTARGMVDIESYASVKDQQMHHTDFKRHTGKGHKKVLMPSDPKSEEFEVR
jgi:hypothetical protein